MIQVGLVGVGPVWNRYRPALSRLRRPLQVEAVYDPVFARAEKAAEQLEADVAPGLQALASRGNVDALLVMDPGWPVSSVLSLLAPYDKPIFCAPWPLQNARDPEQLARLSSTCDVPIVPAVWRRFFPAAIRLQELLATELDDPLRIEIDFSSGSGGSFSAEPSSRSESPSGAESPTDSSGQSASPALSLEALSGWMDFCRNLIRAFPTRARINPFSDHPHSDPHAGPADYPGSTDDSRSGGAFPGNPGFRTAPANTGNASCGIVLEYPAASPRNATGSSASASHPPMRREACFRGTAAWFADPAAIVRPPGTDGWQNRSASHQSNHDPDEDHSRQPVPPIRIECLRGEAIVRSEEQIQWRSGSSEWTSEQLTSERTPEEIMLDVFGRRVVGGLIPVASLEDILRPGELLAALEKS